jgi:3-dehydroquinate synthase
MQQAILPAAGRGARLDRPGTPKPLVDVGGQPLAVRTLAQLAAAGVRRAVVVVGWAAPEVVRALTHHRDLAGLELVFVENPDWEEGLARSVLAARPALHDGPFLVAMADHVFDAPLVAHLAAETPPADGAVALVDDRLDLVFDLDDAVKVRLGGGRAARIAGGGRRVTAVGRRLAPFDAVDAGLFAASPALFDALAETLRAQPRADLADAVARLAAAGRLRAVRAADVPGAPRWDDVDTPASLVHAEMRLRSERRRARVRRLATTAAAAPHTEHRFTTGAPTATRLLVGRGLTADPARLPLVPEESASSPVFVLTDETVNALYGELFVGGLRARGYDVHRLVMADGEESKTLANYTYLVERVLGRGIDERSLLVSLGGGAVCNVTGLLAATLYRGVGLVHVPTTLMAQCDAAISHKQGVNGARGKNLVGAYYAPRLIVVDPDLLATLRPELIPDGLAEVIKHALAQDRDYAAWLLAYDGSPRHPDFLEAVVRRNIALKCDLMARDPKELSEGMALQYGHTAGHPLEYLSGYGLWHGQAVALGMMVAARVARLLGACGDDLVALHERLLTRYGLPTRIPRGLRVPDILAAMRYNKRFLTEGTRMALLADVGRLWAVGGDHAIPVSDAVLARALEDTLEGADAPPWAAAARVPRAAEGGR